MTPESTRPVGEETRKLRAGTGEASCCSLIARLLSQGGKDISETPTLCPGLTCSQEAESHTAEEPGAHGSIRNPGLLLAGAGLLG